MGASGDRYAEAANNNRKAAEPMQHVSASSKNNSIDSWKRESLGRLGVGMWIMLGMVR